MTNYLIKVILLLLVLTIINIIFNTINYNIGLILNYALQNW